MTRRPALVALVTLALVLGCGQLVARHAHHSERVSLQPAAAAAESTTTTEAPTTTTSQPPSTTTTEHRAAIRTSRTEIRPRPVIPVTVPVQIDNSPLKWEGPPGDCNPRVSHEHKADSDHCWSGLLAHWTDWDQGHMLWLLWCESGGNQDARNASGAHGLFQDMNGPFDPWENAVVAHDKWVGGGNGPWVSSRSCWGGH